MYVEKVHQFLSSIKKDAHKRKFVLFFLPHSVQSREPLHDKEGSRTEKANDETISEIEDMDLYPEDG